MKLESTPAKFIVRSFLLLLPFYFLIETTERVRNQNVDDVALLFTLLDTNVNFALGITGCLTTFDPPNRKTWHLFGYLLSCKIVFTVFF